MKRSLPFFLLLLFNCCHPRSRYPPGGYPYPEHIAEKDINYYFYPIRNKIPRSDSFHDALAFMSYRDMDEPNLSIKPMKQDVFRLTYQLALGPGPLIIVLTRDSITVKQGHLTNEFFRLNDGAQLDSLEQKLVNLLDQYYPLDDTSAHHSTRRRHYLDSMGRRYPKLYDPAYYRFLVEKEFAHTKPLFSYTRKSIKTKQKDFDRFVTMLNASDYWHLPISMPCPEAGFDGWGYTLEANTAAQYNNVSDASCGLDTSAFTKACQELIHYAALDDKINLVSQIDPQTHRQKVVVEPVQLEDVKEPKHPKQKKLKTPHPN